MQFEDPQARSNAYLILRHLYDGDVIEWPIGDDHPLRDIFAALETQGYIARWDRVWPLHDRYRLTDRGIATIEEVYRPAGAQTIYNDIRSRNLTAAQRRAYLQQQGYDPVLWPLLHDPSTHWDMYRQQRGDYYDWFWEDQYPAYSPLEQPPQGAVPYVVDLDREANASGTAAAIAGAEAALADHDVS